MNILYDHQIFAAQKYGGISRYHYEIMRRIVREEQVWLFGGYHINNYISEFDMNINKCYSRKRHYIKYTGWIFRYLNKIKFKDFVSGLPIDIYHPTYYEDFNISKGKLIVTVHDMIHELYYKNDITVKKKKAIVEKADGIIVVSESTKNDLVNILKVNPKKIKVIYLANSLNIDNVGDRLFEDDYVLYVGNRGGYKNFRNFLEAMAISKYSNNLNIVCFGGGSFTSDEKILIRDLKIDDKIKLFFGDDKVLANLYKFAEAFVYPSKYEGFGLPPLEAMKYGTPVLASNTSSIPEVVGDSGIYFDPDDVEDISFKIDTLLENSELRNEISRKGVEREKLFSWDRCAGETIEFYRKVVSGGI